MDPATAIPGAAMGRPRAAPPAPRPRPRAPWWRWPPTPPPERALAPVCLGRLSERGTGAKHGLLLRLSPLAAQILREQGPLWQLVFDLLSQLELDEAGWKKWLESAEFQWPSRGIGAIDMRGQEAELRALLLKAHRRKLVSFWFQDRAMAAVEAEAKASASSFRKVLSRLSGKQLRRAVEEGLAGPDPRLVPLVAYAGSSTKMKRVMQQNLQTWRTSPGWAGRDPDQKRIVHLLAGDVDRAAAGWTGGLDWRRAFGLHLWYGQSPTAELRQALAAFNASVSAGAMPWPAPAWHGAPSAADRDLDDESPDRDPGRKDTAYCLLSLCADVLAGGRAAPGKLAELLHPGGLGPERLDCAFQWHLCSVLLALGALDLDAPPAGAGAGGRTRELVWKAGLDMIGELDAVGDLSGWMVYVAMQLPAAGPPGAREALVMDLLARSAPAWTKSQEKRAFLSSVAAIPKKWLARAEGLYAKYRNDATYELDCLLDAGELAAAHALLVERVAPPLFLEPAEVHVPASQLQHSHQTLRSYVRQLGGQSAALGPAWAHGGQIYHAYFQLHEAFGDAQANHFRDAESLQELLGGLEALLAALDRLGVQTDAVGRPTAASRAYARVVARCTHWYFVCGDRAALWERDAGGETARAAASEALVRRALKAADHALMPPEHAAEKLHEAAAALSDLLAA